MSGTTRRAAPRAFADTIRSSFATTGDAQTSARPALRDDVTTAL